MPATTLTYGEDEPINTPGTVKELLALNQGKTPEQKKPTRLGGIMSNVTAAIVRFWETKNPFKLQKEIELVNNLNVRDVGFMYSIESVKADFFKRWINMGFNNSQISELYATLEYRLRSMQVAKRENGGIIARQIRDLVNEEKSQRPK